MTRVRAAARKRPAARPDEGSRAVRPASRLDQWLRARRAVVLLALVVLSLALRGIYFAQLAAGPCLVLHREAGTDMEYFDGWGRAIAAGDWLSASVGVPMHPWHGKVAAKYFATHPADQARLQREAAGSGGRVTAEQLLWSRWTGGHQFYQDPLHAYLVGLIYVLTGPDATHVLVWQMLLGVLANVLIYLIARETFGEPAGAIAGLLAVLCAPLMHYEGLLLRDSTITCAALGVVWVAQRALARDGRTRYVLLGVSLGLAIMLKSTFLLLAVGLLAGIVVHLRRFPRRAVAAAAAVTAGALVAIAPFALRNVALDVPPFALAGSGPLTFVASNSVRSEAFDGFGVDADQMAEVLGASAGRALPAFIETLRPHTAASLAGLLWDRFAATWQWYEIPNNANFYYFRVRAPVLGWLPVTFLVVAPLGLVGLVLGARHFTAAWPLYVAVVCFTLALVVFLVLGRLRAPLLAALIPFAALTIATWLRGRRAVTVATVAAAILLALWIARPLPSTCAVIRPSDWLSPFEVAYKDRTKQALEANDAGKAAAAYLEFVRNYEPDERLIERGGVPATADDRVTARTFARIHEVCADLLARVGRNDEAGAEQANAQRWLEISQR